MRRLPHRPAPPRRRVAAPCVPPSCPGTKSSAASPRSAPAPRVSGRASASAFPGWAAPAAVAATAPAGARTSATTRSSPATTATAATPASPWPTSASASPSPPPTTTRTPPRCSARDSSATGPTRWRPGPARLGLYGFGAAAHLIAQVAVAEGREVFAFTRPGDARSQDFARSLGCAWAGARTSPRPRPSTPPSSSRRWAASCPPRSPPRPRRASWSAPAST